MITIYLSEREFDYEIQALVNSFFPGRRSQVLVQEDRAERVKHAEHAEHADLCVRIQYAFREIAIAVESGGKTCERTVPVTGSEDWHKREGKTAHPYRTYYKNQVKKLLFALLRDFPKEYLPSGVFRRIPAWGTMTGVRPTKIAMKQFLAGKSLSQIRRDWEEEYLCSPEKTALGLRIAEREAALLEKIRYEGAYSLYIGIPFCPTTCLYCSFPSYPMERFGHMAEDYVQALKREISATANGMRGRRLSGIYVGGGTPTALSARQLRELLSHVKQCYPMEEDGEFTVEAGRPDSITEEKLLVLREYGVNRISVNPQTMQQKTLDLIGRRHTVEQTEEAFAMARSLGFCNINMDLIIGLPGETVSDFRDTLRQVKQQNPDSLTIHSLVIKRASRLRDLLDGQGPQEVTEKRRGETMEQMLAVGQEFAREQGYAPYYMYRQKNSAGHAGSSGQENIGFARPGSECLYNILIMEEMQTIAAVGAGASTKRYHPERGQVSRIENVKSITDYIERIDEMIARKAPLFHNKDCE